MSLEIDWKKMEKKYEISDLEISEKDKKNPTFLEYTNNPIF